MNPEDRTDCLSWNLLSYAMEQIPSWEANRFSASQEIPRILRNPNVYSCTHTYPPPVPIQRISPGPEALCVKIS